MSQPDIQDSEEGGSPRPVSPDEPSVDGSAGSRAVLAELTPDRDGPAERREGPKKGSFERRSTERLSSDRPGPIIFVEVIRLLIVLLGIAAGYQIGGGSFGKVPSAAQGNGPILGALVGALSGYVIGGVLGRFVRAAIRTADRRLAGTATPALLAGTLGALACAGLAALAAIPAPVLIPHDVGWIVYVLAIWIGGYFGFAVAYVKSDEIFAVAGLSTRPLARASSYSHNLGSEVTLLDTSAVLDGRLLPLANAGLLSGTLLVPLFVLDEVQAVADAQDPARRRRGRRGLDVLESLRRTPGIDVQVVEDEVVEQSSVDAKLVSLAKRLRVGIITVDLPLQKVAELQDVRCLNLDQLNDLLRATHIPGETLEVLIAREGREPGQGVGYLDDGTMVVVTDAAVRIGEVLHVRVGNVMQTSVGMMIFATEVEGTDR